MPVCSYVVYPLPGQAEQVKKHLQSMAGCEARISADGQLLVLVTDTPDLVSEARLQQDLRSVPGVAQMALSFGYTEPDNLDQMSAKGLPKVARK